MRCGETAVQDARLVKSFRVGKGPELKRHGAFRAKVEGVEISGRLGKKAGSGSGSASKGDCHGSGSWTVARRQI